MARIREGGNVFFNGGYPIMGGGGTFLYWEVGVKLSAQYGISSISTLFYLLFGCPTAKVEPLGKGQP